MRFVHVVGVRPNLVKVAPLVGALEHYADVEQVLVHTGQHFDLSMSQIFFEELSILAPQVNLGIRSSPAAGEPQIGRMIIELDRSLGEIAPDCVVVVGDVDSTLAGALVAVRRGIPCAHVEAGLRSFDRSMPEEINRVVTDRIANLLLTPSADADQNLLAEGIAPHAIHRVGNVMIDTLLQHLERAKAREILDALGLEAGSFAVTTLHRPSNVDNRAALTSLCETLEWIQRRLPLVFPVHPRTSERLRSFSLLERIATMPNIILTEPLGYLDFLALTASSKFVLTDSGGLQEETTVLGIPCLTLRPNTERPVTVSIGTNTIVGSDPEAIRAAVSQILEGRAKRGVIPELWDGRASERAAQALIDYVGGHCPDRG